MYFATDCKTRYSNRANSEYKIGGTRAQFVSIIMRLAPFRFSLKVSSQGLISADYYSALGDFETSFYSFAAGLRGALGTRQSLF